MSQRRNLTFSDDAIEIMDRDGPPGRLGDWLSAIIVNYHDVVNGIVPESNCGELADIVPALRLIAKQNALILAELSILKATTHMQLDFREENQHE